MMGPSGGTLSETTGDLTWHFVIGGLLIVAMVVVGSVLKWLRRRSSTSGTEPHGAQDGGFTMESLEAMRRTGEISEKEFRVLRRTALGLDAGEGKTHNSASSHPTSGDDDEGVSQGDGPCAERDVQEE